MTLRDHKQRTGQPLYAQLAETLRREIRDSRPGERLPSETELSRTHAVSRATAIKAIEALAADGLVRRTQGRGTFVAAQPLHRVPGPLRSFSEFVRAEGRTPTQRLVAFERRPCGEGAGLPADAPVVAMTRLRLVDGLPTAIHRSLVPAALADRIGLTLEAAARIDFSLYALFETNGVVPSSAAETLRARNAGAEDARLLETRPAAALMEVDRTTYDAVGQIIEIVCAIYAGSHYAYDVRLVRERQLPHLVPPHTQERSADEDASHSLRRTGARLEFGRSPGR